MDKQKLRCKHSYRMRKKTMMIKLEIDEKFEKDAVDYHYYFFGVEREIKCQFNNGKKTLAKNQQRLMKK